MRNLFNSGEKKVFITTVDESRLARFEAGLVHPVYATFALAKDGEWVCRLFVLDMLEKNEEGIGAFVSVKHLELAPAGATVKLEALLVSVIKNKIHCQWSAFWNEKLIAHGEQTQYIIDKENFINNISKLSAQL